MTEGVPTDARNTNVASSILKAASKDPVSFMNETFDAMSRRSNVFSSSVNLHESSSHPSLANRTSSRMLNRSRMLEAGMARRNSFRSQCSLQHPQLYSQQQQQYLQLLNQQQQPPPQLYNQQMSIRGPQQQQQQQQQQQKYGHPLQQNVECQLNFKQQRTPSTFQQQLQHQIQQKQQQQQHYNSPRQMKQRHPLENRSFIRSMSVPDCVDEEEEEEEEEEDWKTGEHDYDTAVENSTGGWRMTSYNNGNAQKGCNNSNYQ